MNGNSNVREGGLSPPEIAVCLSGSREERERRREREREGEGNSQKSRWKRVTHK